MEDIIRMRGTHNNLPDIFHIGYQRTGSTWIQKGLFPILSDYLVHIPTKQWDVYFANEKKEISILNDQSTHSFPKDKIIIDSEEAYSGGRFIDYTDTAKKLFWLNPDAKIWIVIRSQRTIIPSLYYLYIRKGGSLSLSSFVLMLMENKKLDYLRLYESYCEYFPIENIKITLFEDFTNDSHAYVQDLVNWMGIPMPEELPNNRYKNDSTPSWYINCQRLLNVITGLSQAPIRTAPDRSEQVLQKFKLRRRLSRPFNIFLAISQSIKWFQKRPSINGSLKQTIDSFYAPSNQILFNRINKDISKYDYPSQ